MWNLISSNTRMEEDLSKIKFLQWNCHSIKRKLPKLQQRANQYDIIFLNETWLSVHKGLWHNKEWQRRPHPWWWCYHQQRMKNLHNYKGKPEVCAYSIYVNQAKTHLAVYYRPPYKHIPEESWTQSFSQFAGKCLIIGDFNAHHPILGRQRRVQWRKKSV